MLSNIIGLVIDFLFIDSGKDFFKIYVYVLLIFSVYSGKFVFETFKSSIDQIKNLVIDCLLYFKEIFNDFIDKSIDKLI